MEYLFLSSKIITQKVRMATKEQESGLYIFKPNSNTSFIAYPQCTLVTTIKENKKMFTK